MTDIENTDQTLETLTQDLQQTLTAPTRQSGDILAEQAQILNQLFTSIINEKVTNTLNGVQYYREDAQGWLAFALRTQKQCTNTIKAKGTLDYMATITKNNASPCHTVTSAEGPHPLSKLEKQTGEPENA